MSTPTRAQLLAQLAQLGDALQHHLAPEVPVGYDTLWPDPGDFLASWSQTPVMQFAEFEATGSLQVTDDTMLADLSLRYLHDDSGDNDRDVLVAVVRVLEGDLWLVLDLFRNPDSGDEDVDPAVLQQVCAACKTAPRQAVAAYVLGPG